MIAESIKELIANNGGNKALIASRLGISAQFLGQLESGKRKKASAELVQKIKDEYKFDILTGKSINETDASNDETKKASEVERLISAFEKTVEAFNKALESKDRQVDNLENDKNWLRKHIDTLTVGFASLKQTQ